jgi:uncharacterized protein
MIQAFMAGREIGLYIEQITRRIRPFVNKTPRAVDCAACGGMIRAYPSGMFGPCGHFVAAGRYAVSANEAYDSHSLDALLGVWRERTGFTLQDSECEDCIARGICGGGCPLNAFKRAGSIFSADPVICVQARKVALWLLKDLWANIKQNRRSIALDGYTYVLPTVSEREMILGKIDLQRPRALSFYSSYGEIIL